MGSLDNEPKAAVSYTADILSRAKEVAELISLVAMERDGMARELERLRRECGALKAQLREVKTAAEKEIRQCEVLKAQLSELGDVTEREITRERERVRRESESMLSDARCVRARALENAKRLDDCIAIAKKCAYSISNDLLSLAEAIAQAKAGLEAETRDSSAITSTIQCSPSSEYLDRVLGLSGDDGLSPEGGSVQVSTHDGSMRGRRYAPCGESVPSSPANSGAGPAGLPAREAPEENLDNGDKVASECGVSNVQGDEPDSSDKGTTPAITCHRLYISPVRGFRQAEELERLLGRFEGVESIRITSWESLGVIVEVDARMSTDQLLDKLDGRFSGLKIAKAS